MLGPKMLSISFSFADLLHGLRALRFNRPLMVLERVNTGMHPVSCLGPGAFRESTVSIICLAIAHYHITLGNKITKIL